MSRRDVAATTLRPYTVRVVCCPRSVCSQPIISKWNILASVMSGSQQSDQPADGTGWPEWWPSAVLSVPPACFCIQKNRIHNLVSPFSSLLTVQPLHGFGSCVPYHSRLFYFWRAGCSFLFLASSYHLLLHPSILWSPFCSYSGWIPISNLRN